MEAVTRSDIIEKKIVGDNTFYSLTKRGEAYFRHIAINLGAVTLEQYSEHLQIAPSQLKQWIRVCPQIAVIMDEGRTYQVSRLTQTGIAFALSCEGKPSADLTKFFLKALAPEVYGDDPSAKGQSPVLKVLADAIREADRARAVDNAGQPIMIEEGGHVDNRP